MEDEGSGWKAGFYHRGTENTEKRRNFEFLSFEF
jgi:hypothetical protein